MTENLRPRTRSRQRPVRQGLFRQGPARRRLAMIATAAVAAVVASTLALTTMPEPASAALSDLPPGFVDEAVVSGLPYASAIAFTPQSDMFIALKGGVVRVADDEGLRDEPFIDISERVHDNDDRGLLGLAIHPDFPAEPYVYLLYTYDPPGTVADQGSPVAGRVSRLERFTADPAADYLRALPDSGVVLLGTESTRENIGDEEDGRNIDRVSCMTGGTLEGTPIRDCLGSDENSHTIGTVAFAPDGSLFVTNGDGANYNSPDPRALLAQNLDSLAGKVLRIDPDTGAGLPDNPFFDTADPGANRSKVWASGLRNPFRMAIHPQTGAPWVGDVGWGTWEEINHGKGANFGWPCYEGGLTEGSEGFATVSQQQSTYAVSARTAEGCAELYAQGLDAVTAPVYTYDHSEGGASANGGAFYVGDRYPEEYRGALFIADYNRRWIRALQVDESGAVTGAIPFGVDTGDGSGPVQVVSGPDTNIYWVKYDSAGGEVRRIRYLDAAAPPVAIATATPTSGVAPLEVTFSARSSYDAGGAALRYEWDFGDGSPVSTEAEPTHVFTETGPYDVRLTVTQDVPDGMSSFTVVRVTAGTDPPFAEVDPLEPSPYAIGDQLVFRGRASTPDGTVPTSGHRWEIRQWHNQHSHFATPTWTVDPDDPDATTGVITVDEHGDDTYYEACLTATSPSGLTDVQCAEARPDRIDYTVETEPAGLSVSYEDEGLRVEGPAVIRPVRGSSQTLTATPIQARRTFVGWSDGVTDLSRTFVAGEGPTSFRAVYENRAPEVSVSLGSPAAGAAPLGVRASASASDPENDTLTYAWTIDGEPAGDTRDLTGSVSTVGEHLVAVTVTDSLGATATAETTVTVTEEAPPGEDVWLSDLPLRDVSNGFGPVELDTTNGEDAAGDGAPITLDGASYARGLGVHAASSVTVDVPDDCVRFTSAIGVDDSVGRNGSVVFSVTGPSGELFASDVRRGGDPAEAIDLDVSGEESLTLAVGDGGDDNFWDHAVWADARFTCGVEPEPEPTDVWVSQLALTDVSNGFGPVEIDSVNGDDAAGDGGPIVLDGATFERGLGVHAASSVTVAVPDGCTRFVGRVGVDDTVGRNGSVVFALAAGSDVLWTSDVLTGGGGGADVDVAVAPGSSLVLRVSDAGDNPWWDHAVWAGARFVCGAEAPEPDPEPEPEPEPEPASGEVALSTLPLRDVANGWGPVELDRSNGEDAAGDGAPLSLAGTPYDRGLGVHAASSITVDVPEGCGRFLATVGVDDSVGANGSVVFTVREGTDALFASDVLVGGGEPAEVDVPVTAGGAITLEVADAGDNNWWDHADWAGARFVCGEDAGGGPEPEPAPEPEPTPEPTPSGDWETLAPVSTGSRTHSVSTADVNADGALDVLAAVAGEDAIVVAFGAGDGTFGPATSYDTGAGSFPKHVEVADLNGDGVLDLVSANQDTPIDADVSVFLGNGDGTFSPVGAFAACERAHESEAADLTGDGIVDLAVACWGGDDVAVLAGDGTGAFAPPVLFPAGNAGHSLSTGDVDNDGDADLSVAAYGSNRVTVLVNDGVGGFSAPTEYWSGLGPHNLQWGDVTGDGVADLVVTAELSDAVGVLPGRGDGTFGDTVFHAVGPRPKASALADVDGDGVIDIVTANTHGNYPNGSTPTSLTVLYGTGAGAFEPAVSVPVSLTPFAVAVGDLDGDGLLELLTANWHSGDVAVLRRVQGG